MWEKPFDLTKGVVSFHRKQNISLLLPAITFHRELPLIQNVLFFFILSSSLKTRFKAYSSNTATEWNAEYLSQVVREVHSRIDRILVGFYLIFFGTWRGQRRLPLPTQRRIIKEKRINHFKKTATNRYDQYFILTNAPKL